MCDYKTTSRQGLKIHNSKLHSKKIDFKDKRGTNQQSRLDFFLTDIETAAHTNKAIIYPITQPFDHSEIALEIDFDKVMRGKGNWKLNNSHLKNKDFIKHIRTQLALIIYEYQVLISHVPCLIGNNF